MPAASIPWTDYADVAVGAAAAIAALVALALAKKSSADAERSATAAQRTVVAAKQTVNLTRKAASHAEEQVRISRSMFDALEAERHRKPIVEGIECEWRPKGESRRGVFQVGITNVGTKPIEAVINLLFPPGVAIVKTADWDGRRTMPSALSRLPAREPFEPGGPELDWEYVTPMIELPLHLSVISLFVIQTPQPGRFPYICRVVHHELEGGRIETRGHIDVTG